MHGETTNLLLVLYADDQTGVGRTGFAMEIHGNLTITLLTTKLHWEIDAMATYACNE